MKMLDIKAMIAMIEDEPEDKYTGIKASTYADTDGTQTSASEK